MSHMLETRVIPSPSLSWGALALARAVFQKWQSAPERHGEKYHWLGLARRDNGIFSISVWRHWALRGAEIHALEKNMALTGGEAGLPDLMAVHPPKPAGQERLCSSG